MNAPLYNKLIKYHNENRISFSMPGHKGRGLSPDLINCDTTELDKTANLHYESDEVIRANKLLAELYGAKRSFIMSSGSTTAVHTMITAALKPGETLLVSSDCHMSVINICAVTGVNLRVIKTHTDNEFLIPKRVEGIGEYIKKYPDIKAVFLTSPNYYGICADIKRASLECHSAGIPLLVDEAHGAHFPSSEIFPKTAVSYADLVCQSAHKTLNALTGAAFLHVNGDLISPEKVREIINIYESSSPSYAIAASADKARDEISSANGWNRCAGLCTEFKKRAEMLGIIPLKNDDPTRLVLRIPGCAGFKADRLLAERFGIDVEMSDLRSIVLIASPQNTESDFDKLYAALAYITENTDKENDNFEVTEVPERDGLISPSRAFYARSEGVELEKSAGRVSKQTVCAYPPGIPIITAGETISQGQIEVTKRLIKAGARVTALKNDIIEAVVE